MATDTLDIILKHIEQLREDVRQGFERIDGRLTRLEERVTIVEKWRAEQEAVEKALDENREDRNAAIAIAMSSRQVMWGIVGGIIGAAALILSALDIFRAL